MNLHTHKQTSTPWAWMLLICTLLLLTAATSHLPVPGPAPAWPSPETTQTPPHPQGSLPPVAYLPFIQSPPAQLWLNTADRQTVLNFYLTTYLASEGVNSGWNGSQGNCFPGTTTDTFRAAVLMRLNYFRQMAGIPELTALDPTYNQKAQAAALMMSANGQLSHDPPTSWDCYSADGDEGAGSSNLFLGVYGPAAISGYMEDPGGGNYFVGHRRWILYPQSQYLGTGDIPPGNGYMAANALWVFDRDHMWGPRPDTRDEFVAWPPPGYTPYQVVFSRWSLAYPGADFANATVSMMQNGQQVTLQLQPVVNGFGENTLVWETAVDFGQPPGADLTLQVTVANVLINGQPQTFNYEVVIFDPEAPILPSPQTAYDN